MQKNKPESHDAYSKAPEFIVVPHPMCTQRPYPIQDTNGPMCRQQPYPYKILMTPCASNSPTLFKILMTLCASNSPTPYKILMTPCSGIMYRMHFPRTQSLKPHFCPYVHNTPPCLKEHCMLAAIRAGIATKKTVATVMPYQAH